MSRSRLKRWHVLGALVLGACLGAAGAAPAAELVAAKGTDVTSFDPGINPTPSPAAIIANAGRRVSRAEWVWVINLSLDPGRRQSRQPDRSDAGGPDYRPEARVPGKGYPGLFAARRASGGVRPG
jgi:hypothetical protein